MRKMTPRRLARLEAAMPSTSRQMAEFMAMDPETRRQRLRDVCHRLGREAVKECLARNGELDAWPALDAAVAPWPVDTSIYRPQEEVPPC